MRHNVRRYPQAFFFIITLLWSFILTSAYADPMNDLYQEQIVKNAVTNMMRIGKIPGVAVDLYVNGHANSYYFGYANQANLQPVNGNTIFEIGSVTKLFTSLLLAEQIKAGHLDFHQNVAACLPDFASRLKPLRAVTVEELATHTSGLPFDAPNSVKSRNGLINFLQNWRFPRALGSTWTYSNIGMGLLGDCLATMSGESYDQLYRSDILTPLSMQPIGTEMPSYLAADYAQGYKGDGMPANRVSLPAREASGSMKASANDMMHFLNAAIGLPGTPAFLLSAMRLTQTPFVQLQGFEQGLAWQMYPLNRKTIYGLSHPPAIMHVGPFPAQKLFFFSRHFDGNMLLDKTGTTAGFRTYIAVIPARQTGIVLLVNRRVSDAVLLSTARKILFQLNGLT